MNPFVQLRLARFVDRKIEMRVFRTMLDKSTPDRPITIIWGDGGIGKSTLMDWMEQECESCCLTKAKVLWSDTRNHDYLGIMREFRDGLGADSFSQFNSLVNFFTVPQYKLELVVNSSGVSVGENMRNEGSIRSMAGINVEDLNISVPRSDLGISEAERMTRLTDMFLRELDAAAKRNPLILFLDAFEKASELTRSWVCNELVGACLDGRLANARIVMCGRIRPPLQDDWWVVVNEMHLSPLGLEDVIEYLDKSRLPVSTEAVADLADTFFLWSEGVPGRLTNAVQAFAKQRERRAA